MESVFLRFVLSGLMLLSEHVFAQNACAMYGASGMNANVISCTSGVNQRTITCASGYYAAAPAERSVILTGPDPFRGCFQSNPPSYASSKPAAVVQENQATLNQQAAAVGLKIPPPAFEPYRSSWVNLYNYYMSGAGLGTYPIADQNLLTVREPAGNKNFFDVVANNPPALNLLVQKFPVAAMIAGYPRK